MGDAGRRRAIEHFDWPAIAQETVALYESMTAGTASSGASAGR